MTQQSSQEEYRQRKEWERQDRQDRFRAAVGLMNFISVAVGALCVFVLLALLLSLLSWLNQDISSTLSVLLRRFQ